MYPAPACSAPTLEKALTQIRTQISKRLPTEAGAHIHGSANIIEILDESLEIQLTNR